MLGFLESKRENLLHRSTLVLEKMASLVENVVSILKIPKSDTVMTLSYFKNL